MKKLLVIFASICVVLVIAIIMYIALAGKDIPPPDISDLIVKRPEVPAKENAYTYFKAATNNLYYPADSSILRDYPDSKNIQEKDFVAIIKQNKEMFNKMEEGLAHKICLTPEIATMDDGYPDFFLKMSRLLGLKANHEILQGKLEEATETAITLLKFGDLVQHDAEGVQAYYIGMPPLLFGLEQARKIARNKATPQASLDELSRALADIGPLDQGLIRAVKVDYRVNANTIDEIAGGNYAMMGLTDEYPSLFKTELVLGYLLQPNRTKSSFAKYIRSVIKNASHNYCEMDSKELIKDLSVQRTVTGMIVRPNLIGKRYLGIMLPAYADLLQRKCQNECILQATRLIVALNIYKKENGDFPERLAGLVPDYIASIPVDPFDGEKFRYDKTKGIVYSIGEDCEDADGSSELISGDESDSLNIKRWNTADAVFMIDKEE